MKEHEVEREVLVADLHRVLGANGSVERLSNALRLGEVVYGDPATVGLIGLRVPRGRLTD